MYTRKCGRQRIEFLYLVLLQRIHNSFIYNFDLYIIVFFCSLCSVTYINLVFELPASSSGMSSQESTAQQMVSDPTLVHVLVRFLSGSSTNGTSQHTSQVGPTATQAMHEFLSRLQVHLSSTCPQVFSEFLLKLMHILSTER